jgi:polyisoprenoid-binding protein YceI
MKSMLTAIFLTGIATCSHADWALNQADSNFNFASLKKNNVYEVHTFNKYGGQISSKGEAYLELDLNSVNTGIEIRDERMKTLLFDTVKFPAAKYSLSLNPATLESLKAGERISMEVEGTLSLFGIAKAQPASLNVFKLTSNRILVSTAKPIALKAADFGLDSGVEALREIAKLPVISSTVPVNFSLVFDQE